MFSKCKLLIADAIAVKGLNGNDANIQELEKIEGFAGILNLDGIKLEHASSELFREACGALDAEYSKLYPNGLSVNDVDYYSSERSMEEVSEISFTSGTTSATSKGVVLPARSLSVNLEFARREVPSCVGGHIFAILPMAHMFGQAFDVLFPIRGKILYTANFE